MWKILLSVPVVLFPYEVVAVLFCIFTGFLMESVFQNNFLFCILALLLGGALALLAGILLCVLSYLQKWQAGEMTRLAMILKLVHIPAYLLIFLWGLACALTIFTIGFSIALMMLDVISIVTTGIVGVFGVRKSYLSGSIGKQEWALHSILQFVFCADVVSAVMVYVKTRSRAENSPRLS